MSNIRRIFMAIASALTAVSPAWCQEYFHPGMSWLEESSSMSSGDLSFFYSTVKIEDGIVIDGETVYPMQKRYVSFPSEYVYYPVYIKNEGAKVYYRERESSDTEWRLMYDFGLEVGDECDIWEATVQEGHALQHLHVTCIGRHLDPDLYCGLEVMDLSIHQTISDLELDYPGIWIVGIGSPMGPYYNYEFNVDGLTSRLIEVRDGDEVTYSQPSASVENPQTWDLQVAVEDRAIIISGHNGDARVYDVAGHAVGSVRYRLDAETRIDMSLPGIYLVVCDGKSRKVVVR